MKVKVIETGLKYKKTDSRGKRIPVFPRVGQIIDLEADIARKEIEGGNVRALLPEEKEALKRKLAARKKKKAA